MKRNKISFCNNCGFKCNEKHKNCPLCNHAMEQIIADKLEINPTLPSILKPNDTDEVVLTYYCTKCHKKVINKACMNCNNPAHLYIEYNQKGAMVDRINSLGEVFDTDEVDYISKNLSMEEKNYLYHNFSESYRFFYHKDLVKAIVCFIFSIIFYSVFLDITIGSLEKEYTYLSYFYNAFANLILCDLIILGVWYLLDASNVLFKKIPQKIFLSTLFPVIFQVLIAMIMNFDFLKMLISGYISIIFAFVLYFIIFLWGKKHEK